MATVVIDDTIQTPFIVSSAGDTKVTSIKVMRAGSELRPRFNGNHEVVAGQLLLMDDGLPLPLVRPVFAIDGASMMTGSHFDGNLLGVPIALKGSLVCRSVLTGGSVEVTTAP